MLTREQIKAAYPNYTPEMVETFFNNQIDLGGATQSVEKTATSTTDIAKSMTKLTYNSAKAMLEQAAKAAGYPKAFTDAEINEYIKNFNAKQAEQIAQVKTISSRKITPDANDATRQRVFEQTMQEEYPSFFKPLEFANDYIWSKVNFGDETTLGSAAIGNLATVRGLVDRFQIIGFNKADAENMAKRLSKGEINLAQATVELQQEAIKEYPQFADRFSKNPALTTYDIADPIISVLAETWEVEKSSIDMKNPLVMKWMNSFTSDGKGAQPTKYDMILAAKKDPKYQTTKAANNEARDAAVSLTRALGGGV